MKVNLPSKSCWLTAALIAACCANSYATPLANKGLSGSAVHAQAPIKGIVKDATGETLVGVSISIKGTTTGTQTDVNGAFTLNASPGDVLVFTYIGYARQEITVGTETNLTVTMKSDAKSLSEVVVTALGIKRESKTLSYGVQTLSGSEVTAVQDPSLVNSLSGKIAGANITRSSGGVGGSTKVVIRGNKSISGDNTVLYVIDGIPMPKNQTMQAGGVFGGQDGGDAISNINPQDIADITVLPGASSTALYGSDGANGVILITTKKGAAGKATINFSSNTTFENPTAMPKFQNTYGQTTEQDGAPVTNSPFSWGAKLSSPGTFDPKSFYNTGKTFINSLSLSTGTDKNQTYFSFASTNATGIVPNNKLDKYNFNVRNTSNFFNNKLTLDVSANYIQQNTQNRPYQGFYYNPIVSLDLFPRGVDFDQYKKFEVYDPTRNFNVQNWPYYISDIATANPYWLVNRDLTKENMSRILGTISLKYTFNSWLSLQGRAKVDRTNDVINQDYYATSPAVLVGDKGAYRYTPSNITQTYGDLILTVNKKISDFSLTANAGAIIQDHQSNGISIGGDLQNYTNVFALFNLKTNNLSNATQYTDRIQSQSLFATANLGYKDFLFLDLSARNDWNSTLAFGDHLSFFYPSAGLNLVLSSVAKLPDFWTFSKIRGSVAGVGSGLDKPYLTTPQYTTTGSQITPIPLGLLKSLKPQNTTSYELGTDDRFMNDNLSLSINFYKTFTTNQLITVNAPSSAIQSTQLFNAGKIRNEGFEFTMGYNAKLSSSLTWRPSVNISANRNKVMSLLTYNDPTTGKPKTVDSVVIQNSAYTQRVQVGGSFGDMYVSTEQKDANGKVITDPATGLPLRSATENYVGNYNPNFTAGFQNAFTYHNFKLSFLIDGRFGGQVISGTQAQLDQYGVSEATAQARDNGGVVVNGKTVDAQAYYLNQGGRTGILGQYVYSATNIRLRELTFGYTFPGSMFNNSIKNITLTAVARNLFFFTNKAPFDPDLAFSTGTGSQGYDLFSLPSVRSVGFNLSVQF